MIRHGVNIGTRFLTAVEAPISAEWKQAILSAASEDAVKVEAWNDIMPTRQGDYEVVPRTLVSPFVARWRDRRPQARGRATELQGEVGQAIAEGRFGELMPFTGQTAGLIREVLPAAEILRRLMTQAENALAQVTECLRLE